MKLIRIPRSDGMGKVFLLAGAYLAAKIVTILIIYWKGL